jgi:hypothetical protein
MCLYMAALLISKFSVTEFILSDLCAIIPNISLLVGSAIAWNTSLLIIHATFWLQKYMQPFGFTNFLKKFLISKFFLRYKIDPEN